LKTTSTDGPGPLDAILAMLQSPGPVAVSGLAGLMLVTLYVGITHAADPDEEPRIRITGALLAGASLAALGAGVYSALEP